MVDGENSTNLPIQKMRSNVVYLQISTKLRSSGRLKMEMCFEFRSNFLYLSPSSQSLLMLYLPDFKEKFWVQQLAFHFKHCLLCTRAMSYFTPKYQVSNDAGSIKQKIKRNQWTDLPCHKMPLPDSTKSEINHINWLFCGLVMCSIMIYL